MNTARDSKTGSDGPMMPDLVTGRPGLTNDHAVAAVGMALQETMRPVTATLLGDVRAGSRVVGTWFPFFRRIVPLDITEDLRFWDYEYAGEAGSHDRAAGATDSQGKRYHTSSEALMDEIEAIKALREDGVKVTGTVVVDSETMEILKIVREDSA